MIWHIWLLVINCSLIDSQFHAHLATKILNGICYITSVCASGQKAKKTNYCSVAAKSKYDQSLARSFDRRLIGSNLKQKRSPPPPSSSLYGLCSGQPQVKARSWKITPPWRHVGNFTWCHHHNGTSLLFHMLLHTARFYSNLVQLLMVSRPRGRPHKF